MARIARDDGAKGGVRNTIGSRLCMSSTTFFVRSSLHQRLISFTGRNTVHDIGQSKKTRLLSYHHVPTPPPCSLTPFLSRTSTFLLRSCLSSGLMTFSLAFCFPSSPSSIAPLLPGRLRPSTADVAAELLPLGEDGLSAGLRWRRVGVGKLFRLSTASTVR